MEETPSTSAPAPAKQAALSAVIIVHLLIVVIVNWHPTSGAAIRRWIDTRLQPSLSQPLYMAENKLRYYAYLVGLDPRWTMFSSMAPYTGMYALTAHYADGTIRQLPLPLQSPRTFWQRQLFDFKEPKFHSNLAYLNPVFRETYSRYLCRTYPRYHQSAVTAIVWGSEWQMILDQQAAARQGHHWDPTVHASTLYTFACPAPKTAQP